MDRTVTVSEPVYGGLTAHGVLGSVAEVGLGEGTS